MNVAQPMEGETIYSPTYIYRQIFGTAIRGHHQKWPDIRLDELRELNGDTIGWIRMEGTPINYPVVRGRREADYYLSHNFSQEESYHGAIHMDYRNGGVLAERTTLLAGHHMKDSSMFFALTLLFTKEFYEEHRGLELLLFDGLYRADFFAVHYINSRDPEPVRVRFASDADYGAWLSERKRQSLYDIPLTPTVRDRVLVLTTCVFPEDPDDWRDEIAVYALLRKVEDRAFPPSQEKRFGKLPLLVNLWHPLSADYAPDPVSVEEGIQIDRRCYYDLMELLTACRSVGGHPKVTSAYRTEEEQAELFEQAVKDWLPRVDMDRRLARGAASWYTALPGRSEHQTGLAADISYAGGVGDELASFTVAWLEENAWRFGFILRYPKGKEEITGVIHEPWHYRHVGREYAAEIHRLGVTLEEYLELVENQN